MKKIISILIIVSLVLTPFPMKRARADVSTTSLISYWKLDETSGTRVDVVSAENLTDNNTVLFGAGKIGNAGDFESTNSESLSHADDANLSTGDIDFSITCWVNFESLGAKRPIVSKQNDGTNGSYDLRYDTGGNFFQFRVWGSAAFGNVDSVGVTTPSLATWYFLVAWHDATANTINLQINNGTVSSQAHTTGSFNDAGIFSIGATAVFSEYMDGLIDECGWWKRVLTAAERTALYNGGAGLAYPFTTASASIFPRLNVSGQVILNGQVNI